MTTYPYNYAKMIGEDKYLAGGGIGPSIPADRLRFLQNLKDEEYYDSASQYPKAWLTSLSSSSSSSSSKPTPLPTPIKPSEPEDKDKDKQWEKDYAEAIAESSKPPSNSKVPKNMADTREYLIERVNKAFDRETQAFRNFLVHVLEQLVVKQTALMLPTGGSMSVVNTTLALPRAVDTTGKLPPLKAMELWYEFSSSLPTLCPTDEQSVWAYFQHGALLFGLWQDVGAKYKAAGGGNMLLKASLHAAGDTLYVNAMIAADDQRPLCDSYNKYAVDSVLETEETMAKQLSAQDREAVQRVVATIMKTFGSQTAEHRANVDSCVRTIVQILTLTSPSRAKVEWSLALVPDSPGTYILRAEGMESVALNVIAAIKQRFDHGRPDARPDAFVQQVGVGISKRHQLISDVAPWMDVVGSGGSSPAEVDINPEAALPVCSHALILDFKLQIPEPPPAASPANVPIPKFDESSPSRSSLPGMSFLQSILGKRQRALDKIMNGESDTPHPPAPPSSPKDSEGTDTDEIPAPLPKRLKLF